MICDLLFTRLSAVRKVLETLVFQELGIFESKTVRETVLA